MGKYPPHPPPFLHSQVATGAVQGAGTGALWAHTGLSWSLLGPMWWRCLGPHNRVAEPDPKSTWTSTTQTDSCSSPHFLEKGEGQSQRPPRGRAAVTSMQALRSRDGPSPEEETALLPPSLRGPRRQTLEKRGCDWKGCRQGSPPAWGLVSQAPAWALELNPRYFVSHLL